MAGSCYLFLGDVARAQTVLGATADALHGGSKAQAIVLGNLSLTYLRQRKIEEAATSLHEAIDVVERTRGGGGLNVVFNAGRELRSWRQVTVAREVSDRLLDLVAG